MKKTAPRSRSGAGVLEYMLILGTIGAVCVAATVLLGGHTSSLLERSLTSSQPALLGAVIQPVADSGTVATPVGTDGADSSDDSGDGTSGKGNGNSGKGNSNSGKGNGNSGKGNGNSGKGNGDDNNGKGNGDDNNGKGNGDDNNGKALGLSK